MSFSFSFSAKDKAEAKEQLAAKIADENNRIPTVAGELVAAAIDALPPTIPGYGTFSVSSYGHFDAEGQTTSNIQVSVQHCADAGDQPKVA